MKKALGTAVGDLTGAKWNAIITNAKARGHKVSISQQEAANLFKKQNGQCALSGLPLVLNETVKRSKFITASLDRIDSNKGYERGNVQWVHKDVNKMKNTFEQGYFVELCRKISVSA
jgi:hypothetical protein